MYSLESFVFAVVAETLQLPSHSRALALTLTIIVQHLHDLLVLLLRWGSARTVLECLLDQSHNLVLLGVLVMDGEVLPMTHHLRWHLPLLVGVELLLVQHKS